VARVGRLAPEHDRRPLRAAEDLVEQRELELAVPLAAELGPQMRRPEVAAAHFFLQWIDDLAPRLVQRHELLVRPEQVERLDLLAHERVDPVELLLELGLGFEVPCHGSPPRRRQTTYESAASPT